MTDPEAAAKSLELALKATGEQSLPEHPRVPDKGILAAASAQVISEFSDTHRHQPVEWWLALLESVDFAAIGVAAVFGGQAVRIRKGRTPQQKADAIARHLRAGLAVEDAFKAAGVSRATGYRLVSKRQRTDGGS